mmetsp:Transcript_29536/g.50291  ORF Transcript_29536/g.50291 Transcript_29536/m.50291 type:complete len:222 (-) Transcript_29536:110-775(-)
MPQTFGTGLFQIFPFPKLPIVNFCPLHGNNLGISSTGVVSPGNISDNDLRLPPNIPNAFRAHRPSTRLPGSDNLTSVHIRRRNKHLADAIGARGQLAFIAFVPRCRRCCSIPLPNMNIAKRDAAPRTLDEPRHVVTPLAALPRLPQSAARAHAVISRQEPITAQTSLRSAAGLVASGMIAPRLRRVEARDAIPVVVVVVEVFGRHEGAQLARPRLGTQRRS